MRTTIQLILMHVRALAKAGKIRAAVDTIRRLGHELASAIRIVTALRAA